MEYTIVGPWGASTDWSKLQIGKYWICRNTKSGSPDTQTRRIRSVPQGRKSLVQELQATYATPPWPQGHSKRSCRAPLCDKEHTVSGGAGPGHGWYQGVFGEHQRRDSDAENVFTGYNEPFSWRTTGLVQYRELPKEVTADDFEFRETLGTGTFGRVRLVQHKATKEFYAAKILNKARVCSKRMSANVLRERDLLMTLRHPFIVNLMGSFKDREYLYVLMEYVQGGELYVHLRESPRQCFHPAIARFYASQVLLALQYLHEQDIAYRDLKPSNIMLDRTGYIKLVDFGFAKKMVGGRTRSVCGTPEYVAPEIIRGEQHGKEVDIWSLGVLLFEMMAGFLPFEDDTLIGLSKQILNGIVTFPLCFSTTAKELILHCMHPDPCQRPTVAEVISHEFFDGTDWEGIYCRRTPPPFLPVVTSEDDTGNFDKYPEEMEGSCGFYDHAEADRLLRAF